jgi:hypothetical protein
MCSVGGIDRKRLEIVMEKELFDDLVQGLTELVAYSKGELKEPVDEWVIKVQSPKN